MSQGYPQQCLRSRRVDRMNGIFDRMIIDSISSVWLLEFSFKKTDGLQLGRGPGKIGQHAAREWPGKLHSILAWGTSRKNKTTACSPGGRPGTKSTAFSPGGHPGTKSTAFSPGGHPGKIAQHSPLGDTQKISSRSLPGGVSTTAGRANTIGISRSPSRVKECWCTAPTGVGTPHIPTSEGEGRSPPGSALPRRTSLGSVARLAAHWNMTAIIPEGRSAAILQDREARNDLRRVLPLYPPGPRERQASNDALSLSPGPGRSDHLRDQPLTPPTFRT